jgi:CubicO group peptidase (beta-lactamase class C family)
MTRGLIWASYCLAFVSLASTVSSCTDSDNSRLRSLLQKGIDRGYPGIAVMIQSPDGGVESAAAGYSDLEHHVRMRVDDGFQMASISKTLTAVAVLRLVDAHKLSLSTTLKECLGEAVAKIPNAERITVSQLLDHSSGIYPTNNDMDYLTTVIGPKADPTRSWTPQELIALAIKPQNHPTSEPGQGHHYSDTNYILLGMIVEKVSGHPFKEHLSQTVLTPLGMNSTYFYSSFLGKNADPPVRTVQGYLLATDELRSAININGMFKAVPGDRRSEGQLLNTTLAAERIDAAAGLVTILPDLLKFASALFRGELLSEKSQAFLMSAGESMNAQSLDKKRIWAMQAVRKPYGVLVYKDGDGPGGVNTLMAYNPATHKIFVGFINVFGYFNEVDFLMDDVFGGLARSKSSSRKSNGVDPVRGFVRASHSHPVDLIRPVL